MKLLRALTIAALAVEAAALAIGGKQMTVERDSDGLQDIVTTPFFFESISRHCFQLFAASKSVGGGVIR
jgi:hypothetical protein